MLGVLALLTVNGVVTPTTFAAPARRADTSATTCQNYNSNPCDDGRLSCYRLTSAFFSDPNDLHIGTAAPANYTLASLDQNCYCQYHSYFDDNSYAMEDLAVDPHVLLTRCTGTGFGANQYKYWYNGSRVQIRQSSLADYQSDFNSMECYSYTNNGNADAGIKYNLTDLKYVDVAWDSNAPQLDEPLPAWITYANNVSCPGYALDYGTAAQNDVIAPSVSRDNAIDCSCRFTFHPGASSFTSIKHGPWIHTVCDADTQSFWNGQGFRKTYFGDMSDPRKPRTDFNCDSGIYSDAVAFVALTSTTGGGGTSTSTSENSTPTGNGGGGSGGGSTHSAAMAPKAGAIGFLAPLALFALHLF
ncbi:hypothetical protein JCM8097_009383 [Rhodosporidiobolus ruineniae]